MALAAVATAARDTPSLVELSHEMRVRPRRFRAFTCDRGVFSVDVDRDPPERITAMLQEVIESGFWRELDRFPVDAIARSLPNLQLPRNTRRLIEIWIKERGDGEAAA